MLETPSLFDAMEQDTTMQRVASRRALALAHKRVESHLGAFFRGAQSEEEFFERLALVQDDFAGYVHTAAEEVGHENSDNIAIALKDHYREAAAPKFIDPKKEEEEDFEGEEEDPKTSKTAWTITAAGEGYQLPRTEEGVWPQDNQGWHDYLMNMDQEYGTEQRSPLHHDGRCPMCNQPQAQTGLLEAPGSEGQPGMSQYNDPYVDPNGQQGGGYAGQMPEAPRTAGVNVHPDQMIQPGQMQNPAMQQANDPTQMPQAAGMQAQPPSPGMPQPPQLPVQHGQPQPGQPGTVDPTQVDPNNPYNNITAFTDPTKMSAWTITADGDSPAGFGTTEQPINKQHKEPAKPDTGDVRHPTKEKDILEPMVYKNRDEGNDLKEIGESQTKTIDLPAATGDDSGFSTETPGGKAPHTKTFPKGDQASPVTHETIGSRNPLVELLSNDEFPSDAVVQAAFARR
jgi:hypothetical protein